MQQVTPKLIEAYESLSGRKVPVQADERDEYFRLEAPLDRASALEFDPLRLERAMAILPDELQKVHFDISALESHLVGLAEDTWKESLRRYIEDARPFEEPWNARVTATFDKNAVIRETRLDTGHFEVVPIFMVSTLLNKRHLPLAEQLQVLFRSREKKTVFVLLDSEVFLDGPFLCLTDWNRITNVTYSEQPFISATKRIDMIQQECSWQGTDRVYLPEFLEFETQSCGLPDLMGWLESLGGALGLLAVANASTLENKRTQLTFWGMGKRQIVLNGMGVPSKQTAEGSRALYSWIYHEVPHPNAALRIARNSVAQYLGPEPEANGRKLESNLADIMSSARANYALFVQEKIEDFFELGKEISRHTNSVAEHLYKTVGDLNASMQKSVLATLGVIAGAFVSTTAVQLNPMTYTSILIAYGLFLVSFYIIYLPRITTAEFSDHLRRFRNQLEPYREFLSYEQQRKVFDDVPAQNEATFRRTRRVLRSVNGILAATVLILSGFDVPSIAKSFKFVPTWVLGHAVKWFWAHATGFR